jgi:hypothetical protein
MVANESPDILAWAKLEAERLCRTAQNTEITDHLGYTEDARPLAAAALDILRRHASGTEFLRAAEGVFHTRGGPPADQALRRVADVLEAWVQFVQDGLEDVPSFPVRARAAAVTDLMDQVQQLLDDSNAHPSAHTAVSGLVRDQMADRLRSRLGAKGSHDDQALHQQRALPGTGYKSPAR